MKFFDIELSYWEPVNTVATVQAESQEDAVEKTVEFFSSFTKDLEILSVEENTEMEPPKPERPRPNLKIVN